MDTTNSPAVPDNRLTEQLVVQETKAVRNQISRLRIAYLVADGTKPSESEAVRRLIRAGLPILYDRLGLDDATTSPGGDAT